MIARDLYLKTTTKKGVVSVTEHRVWDAERFMASQQQHALKEGSSVEPSSREEYQANRKSTKK